MGEILELMDYTEIKDPRERSVRKEKMETMEIRDPVAVLLETMESATVTLTSSPYTVRPTRYQTLLSELRPYGLDTPSLHSLLDSLSLIKTSETQDRVWRGST